MANAFTRDDQVWDAAKNYLDAMERCLAPGPNSDAIIVDSCVYAAQNCAVVACELMLKSLMASSVYTRESSKDQPSTLQPQARVLYRVSAAVVDRDSDQSNQNALYSQRAVLLNQIKEAQDASADAGDKMGSAHNVGTHDEGRRHREVQKQHEACAKSKMEEWRILEDFVAYAKHDGLVERQSDEVKGALKSEFSLDELEDLNKLNLPLQASRYPWDADLTQHMDLHKWICIARRLSTLITREQPEV